MSGPQEQRETFDSSKRMNEIIRLFLGQLTLPENHPRAADGGCQIYGYAINHGDGIIVVDTGTRAGHELIDELYHPEVVSIVDALNGAGLDERDVAAVVNSHLHFDHCGQNNLLPHAPVWTTEAEIDAASQEFFTVPEWAHISLDRRRFSNDGESIAPGVAILHTPGHTPGHQSVAVDTDLGLELIVGQACYTCAEYVADQVAEPDMHDESWLQIGRESLARLRALAPARAHFSHDVNIYTPT